MGFDRVEYDHPDGVRVLSQKEFAALGPLERVKGIGQGRFRFYRNGEKVTAVEALKVAAKAS